MKKAKKILIEQSISLVFILTFFTTFGLQAQNTAEDIMKDPDFVAYKNDYIANVFSDGFKKRNEVEISFFKATNFKYEEYKYKGVSFEDWIKENLDQTSFSSIEEALERYKEYEKATKEGALIVQQFGERKRELEAKFEDKELFEKVYENEVEKVLINKLESLRVQNLEKYKQ